MTLILSVFCLKYIITPKIIDWKSSKQSIVVDFIIKSEHIALLDTMKEAMWIKKFVAKLSVVPSIENLIEFYCNNNEVIMQTKEPRCHQ